MARAKVSVQSTHRNPWFIAAVLVGTALINACVATQPLPSAARAGDTITLAVGSADGMTTSNTTVEFFPGTDPSVVTPIPVPIRSIVKVYPDKTSNAWLGVTTIAPRSSHGNWLSIVAVDLPASLPVGAGVIQVTTDGQVTYPLTAATPNGTDILMEVLPGAGSPNPFDYLALDLVTETGDLGRLEQLPQVIIKPPVPPAGTAQSQSYGAIEVNITVPLIALDGSTIVDQGIAVVHDDQPQNLTNQANLIWKRNGDNFTIMLVSPLGMYSYQARVSIVPKFPDYLYQINGTPVFNSITYYDLNGVPVTGPVPQLVLVN